MFISSLRDIQKSKSHFSHFTSADCQFKILVNEDPIRTEKGLKLKGNILGVIRDSITIETIGKIAVYVNDTNTTCSYGDVIICKGTLSAITSAQNPYEFDNSVFSTHKNIYHQLFIAEGNYKIIQHQQCNFILAEVHDVRKYLSSCFETSIENMQAESVAKALIIGDDDDIDKSLMQAYSSCGVIHVLSVSGLHVGIFYIIINFLFSLIKKENKKVIVTKAILIILLVWFYAALSGFSPSVLRSAVMLTFIAFGNALARKINIFNSLAASAVFLLMYNSDYLFDVGFQLSYISVFGIIYLQPKVYNCWAVKNYLGDKIWQMTSVSLAAQFVTFPLSIYYFYQFPTLFLLANLIIIPLITIALFAGFSFLVLCFSHSTSLLYYSVKPLEYILIIINKFILWMNDIPYNSIKNIFLSPLETICIYLLFFLFFLWIELKQVRLLQLLLASSICFMIFLSIEKITNYQKSDLIIYSLNKMQRIEIIHQGYSQVITSEHLEQNDKNFTFHIKPFRVHQKVMQEKETLLQTGIYEVEYGKLRLLILNEKYTYMEFVTNLITYDLIIIGNDAITDYDYFKKRYHYKQLVFDNTNSRQFIQEAKQNLLSFHNIKTDKAFLMEL